MNFTQLWYLQLIVAHGSFAAAARAAGVSQPAVTQAMQALERAWCTPLFERIGRQKRPTRAALALARQADSLQRQFEQLAASASDPGGEPVVQTLRVGLAPAAALLYGATVERVWRSHAAHGLLRLQGGSAPELLADLMQGDLDLVIAPRPRRYRTVGISQHLLHRSQPTIYCRAGHPLAGATSLADIADAAWAVTGNAGTAGNVVEEAYRVRRMSPPRILVQCADYTTALHLVAGSDLLCVVPHPALVSDLDQATLQTVRVREGLPQYEVCLFWPTAGRSEAAIVEAVVAALTGAAAVG